LQNIKNWEVSCVNLLC